MAEKYLDDRPFRESSYSNFESTSPWWNLVQVNPVQGSTSQSIGTNVDEYGNISIQQGQANVLLLPDQNGKIKILPEAGFVNNVYSFPPDKIRQYENTLKKAGYLPADYIASGYPDSNGKFASALLNIARAVSLNNFAKFDKAIQSGTIKSLDNPIGMDEYLNRIVTSGGKTTTTRTDITTFDAADARGILEQFYADSLGRRPTDEEVAKFNTAINDAAKKKPSVTTSTTDTMGNTVSTGSNGFGQAEAQLMARTTAESAPGARGFMNSTKYMDAFMQALEGKVGQ